MIDFQLFLAVTHQHLIPPRPQAHGAFHFGIILHERRREVAGHLCGVCHLAAFLVHDFIDAINTRTLAVKIVERQFVLHIKKNQQATGDTHS